MLSTRCNELLEVQHSEVTGSCRPSCKMILFNNFLNFRNGSWKASKAESGCTTQLVTVLNSDLRSQEAPGALWQWRKRNWLLLMLLVERFKE